MVQGRLLTFVTLLVAGSVLSAGCGDDDDSGGATGGSAGSSAGTGGSIASGGTSTGGTAGRGGSGGTSGSGATAGAGRGGSGGSNAAGAGGEGEGGSSGGAGGEAGAMGGAPGATGGTSTEGGAAGAGASGGAMGGQGGAMGGEGGAMGGEGGVGGADQALVERGRYLVRSVALCGGCHTASGGLELGGNPQFKGGALPAPNLTADPTGIGDWTDDQIITAFRDGVDDEGRQLDPAMPYWFFHNMSDHDAQAIVAFLRSLPPSSGEVGAANPAATAVAPLSPTSFPDSSLASGDPDYAEAQQGRYLLSGVAQCVRCHSTSSGGLPAQSFFSGVAPTSATQIFAPNITPDTTGIAGWTADDVLTALKAGTNKAGVTLCGSMPSAAKGYGGLSDADAHAIGVYLTTIPAVSKPSADPSLEPACP